MQGLRRAIADAAACGRRFLADDSAATVIEYGVIASGIAVAIIATIFALGTAIKESLYDAAVAALQSRN
jgi:pilus assembly protein Flp/PilA